MLQGQGIAPLLELVQCTLLGNALHRAHKLPSLLYTECLQSHQMLFFCFILLVSCEASLSCQMNHIVIGCNEFNYAISFFIMKQSHILQTGKVLFGPTALSWSLARKAQLRTNRSFFFFFPLFLSVLHCLHLSMQGPQLHVCAKQTKLHVHSSWVLLEDEPSPAHHPQRTWWSQ